MLKTLGIIGKTCSGKSTIARRLLALAEQHAIDCRLFDADQQTHLLYHEDQAVISTLGSLFPEAIGRSPSWHIDTKTLGGLFAASPDNRQAIEAVVYPALTQRLEEIIGTLQAGVTPGLLLIDAPTLFKAGWQYYCDSLLLVTAPQDRRRQRGITRWVAERGMSEQEAAERFALMDSLQPGEDEIRRLAGDIPLLIVENDADEGEQPALGNILEQLFGSAVAIHH